MAGGTFSVLKQPGTVANNPPFQAPRLRMDWSYTYACPLFLYKHVTGWPFIHSVFCLTTGPSPRPKRFHHIVRSRAFFFKWEYPLLSLRSSSSFPLLLPRIFVTSISPFIFPLITCFSRQFLRKMWPIQLAFRFLVSCWIFLCSLTLSNTSSFLIWSIQLFISILLQVTFTFQKIFVKTVLM